jgi:hypothetical protein
MAEPSFLLDLAARTFTFSNDGGITIVANAEIDVLEESITVTEVTLKNPHHDSFPVPLHDFVAPAPLAAHVFDQFDLL